MTNFEKVGLFMKTFGQEVKSEPGLSNVKINRLRIDLRRKRERLRRESETISKKA